MNKLTILTGVFALTAVSILSSCSKNEDDCKVCHYSESDGSTVSMGELCGDEYKTVQTSGFVTSTGHHPVTCE